MKTSLALAVAVLSTILHALTSPAHAADAADSRVDAILGKYVEALGGKGAIEKLTNSVTKGTVTVSGMDMQMELFRAAPALQATRIEIPSMGTIREVYDGKHAWSLNPFAGNGEKTGEELAKTARDAAFHQPLQMKQLFAPLAHKGSETVATRKVEVLEAKLAGGAVERFYFDAESGLLARRDAEVETPAGRVKTQSLIEDYRPVDGVKQPHRLRLSIEAGDQPAMELEFKLTEIRQNVVLPANTFAKPE